MPETDSGRGIRETLKLIEKKIAARLLKNGGLTERDLERGLAMYTGEVSLTDLLVARGFINSVAACRAIAEANGFQFIALDDVEPHEDALAMLTADQAWRMHVLPIWLEDGNLTIAMGDASNVLAQDELRIKLRCPIVTLIAEPAALEIALQNFYGPPTGRDSYLSSDQVRVARMETEAEENSTADFDRRSTQLIEMPDDSQLKTQEVSTDQDLTQPQTVAQDAATMESLPKTVSDKTEITPPQQETPTEPEAVPESDERSSSSSGETPRMDAEQFDSREEIASSTGNNVIIGDPKSHREFQRLARQLRRTGDEPGGISKIETKMFEEASTEALYQFETRRMESGAYEVPKVSPVAKEAPHPSDPPAIDIVRKIMTAAIEARVEEVEFTPLEQSVRLRRRVSGVWEAMQPYPLRLHENVILRLRRIANLEDRQDDLSVEHQFQFPTGKGDILCVAWFESTLHGERALLRLPENMPLMSNPLISVGVPQDLVIELRDRLSGSGGGLLMMSGPGPRTLNRLYVSLIRSLAASGHNDVLSLERPVERQIPGVTQINCPNEDVLMASLANASFMNPDVLALSAIENGTVLNRLMNVAIRGTGVLSCYASPTSKLALQCYKAAHVDDMNILRGVVGHLHVEEAHKLCPHCREVITDDSSLPEWAKEMQAEFYQPGSCDRCRNTGHQGTVWLTEFYRPDPEACDGSFEAVIERDRDVIAASLGGDIDPRDYPL